jgi:hypothetical protein
LSIIKISLKFLNNCLHIIKVVHKFVSIYKPKSPHKMKKFFAFALVASMMSLAACSEKKTEGTTDSTTVSVDTTMSADTTKK